MAAAASSDSPKFDEDTGKGSVGHLFNCLNEKKHEPTSPAFIQTILELFEAHPYVRKREFDFYNECPVKICSHSFQVRGFTPDTYKFSKWIKNEGKQYKHIAGGVADDGLYKLSEVRVTKVTIEREQRYACDVMNKGNVI